MNERLAPGPGGAAALARGERSDAVAMEEKDKSTDAAPVTNGADDGQDNGQDNGGAPLALDNRDYESEARNMGWVPEEEFRGDPGKHISAKVFVETGEQKIPLLVANNKKLSSRLDELSKSMAYQAEHHEKSLKQANKRARDAVEAEMLDAVDEGDRDQYINLKKKRDNIVDPEPIAKAPDKPPEIIEFESDNLWYKSDNAMTAVAEAESKRLAAQFPSLSVGQNLERTLMAVKTAFPDRFSNNTTRNPLGGNTKRNEPGAVGGGKPRAKATSPSFVSLPDDAKQAFDRFFKDKVFGADISKADAQKKYVATYKWD